MSIHVALRHTTRYRFDRPIELSPHVVRLRPAAHSRTPIVSYSLTVRPDKHFINWQQDPFGNYLARLVFPEKTEELLIDVEVIADLTVVNPFDFFIEDAAQHWPFAYEGMLAQDLAPYRELEAPGPLLAAFLAAIPRDEQPTIDFLVALNQRLQGAIGYTVRLEPGVQSCEQTLGSAIGSCRDTGWLLVQVLRHLGLAARFVSGYLVQLTADEKSLDGPSGTEKDFTDLHAWAEVFVPGAGWIGLDPTSGLFAGEGHIPLAATPHPSSAAPIEGLTDPCEVDFGFSNTVTRFKEDPRVTKPYTEEQWAQIRALGRLVDANLQAMDVRLTQGGEPTFVSVDDMEGAEWNTAALGKKKSELADVLARRLKARFAPGALLHMAQGKWYPGEPLPRWALGLFWRKDGVPVWRDEALLAESGRDHGHDAEDARRFAETLARHLGLAGSSAQPAFEDGLHALQQEAEMPANLDAAHADLKAPAERRRLAQVLSRGLDTPVGYLLPLGWSWSAETWYTMPWEFRRGRLYLVPGDSPMGLRLPLASLPWVPADEVEHESEADPFAPHLPLADFHGEVAARFSRIDDARPDHPEIHPQAPGDKPKKRLQVPHTAVCVEARGGCLHVFLPPMQRLEHALELISAVEHTAAALKTPVTVEGYAPPGDARLQKLLVTPDPGVIEVNVQPASNWDELEAITTQLYEEARLSRLGTDKFMLDGRHSGTGGGNHVTFGAAAPGDSPFLRRPDLLRSIVTYWQHHPSLSYLFSGMFVGPTSQAPRVDEGRAETLYELEIAFQQMPAGEVPQPWLVDRLFRHLLADITGNTHRSEFCIDKLYSPDSAAGRQGLLEFRGFEMPPHARMSLAQMLLLRGLLARFWKTPYAAPLVRWGTALHDRWMLPHFLWNDLKDVVADLAAAGYAFEADWFAPFLEFRFPRHGSVQLGDIDIEVRGAIEPWHVLGEEVTGLGTARFVDSSVERVQLKVTGLTDGRYALACNGRRVPLRNTGVQGEYVAGVRYRAWQPPSGLHPTIGVHSPLVFDLFDLWNGRAIGGCTYHVMHPGGRSYETFPVNAWEAEARRHIRFHASGHTPGGYPLPADEMPGEYPFTLDLRRDG
ncbi:MAG: transglutaminase family protein [Gammaproteobacteria bacterium]|nr:transglutaminase family protein [Gammaproteobacteria bacterium]MBU1646567.1 transglutaminase family protein [Gammaproteobacteria bacterium]MBU1972824.1 transglutaminase family protein [Gammaproteobacteria bacterium]